MANRDVTPLPINLGGSFDIVGGLRAGAELRQLLGNQLANPAVIPGGATRQGSRQAARRERAEERSFLAAEAEKARQHASEEAEKGRQHELTKARLQVDLQKELAQFGAELERATDSKKIVDRVRGLRDSMIEAGIDPSEAQTLLRDYMRAQAQKDSMAVKEIESRIGHQDAQAKATLAQAEYNQALTALMRLKTPEEVREGQLKNRLLEAQEAMAAHTLAVEKRLEPLKEDLTAEELEKLKASTEQVKAATKKTLAEALAIQNPDARNALLAAVRTQVDIADSHINAAGVLLQSIKEAQAALDAMPLAEQNGELAKTIRSAIQEARARLVSLLNLHGTLAGAAQATLEQAGLAPKLPAARGDKSDEVPGLGLPR